MRRLLLYILLAFTIVGKAQSFALRADSLLLAYMKDLPAKYAGKYDTILKNHSTIHLADSIKTLQVRYMIIDEYYCCETKSLTTEIYRNAFLKDDIVFKYLAGQVKESTHVGKLVYAKWETSQHTRRCLARSHYKENVKKEIEATYRILTMIDRETGEVRVSLQYPPKRAACHIIHVGGGKC